MTDEKSDNPLDNQDPVHVDPPATVSQERAQSSGAATAPSLRQDSTDDTQAQAQEGTVDYAAAGLAFTEWFNDQLRRLPNTQLKLGLKVAQAVRLHPDGRLQCSLVASAGESEETFIPFEGRHLDQLVRKIGALSH